jgi:simple sugar transport system ATP-binding protein
MGNTNVLEMKSICKSFAGVHALKNVDFSVRKGEVHALLGENGAGKSTLIKILTGFYKRDSGLIIFNDKEINPREPYDAQCLGISPIYQELNLIPDLSVSENIFLGVAPKTKTGLIDRKQMYVKTQELLGRLDLDIDVKLPVNIFGAAIQQMIAIVRAIHLKCNLLVMDEPTSSLDTKEVNVLMETINDLRKQNLSIIFISHRLEEVFRICDKVTVLKDGERVGTCLTREVTKQTLVSMMIGRDFSQQVYYKDENSNDFNRKEYLIELDNIVFHPKVNGVTFGIKTGEILGLAGLLGSGRTETAKVLFGYEKPESGNIKKNQHLLHLKIPRDAVALGIAMCPENRREEGIIPNMTVRDNISLAALPGMTRFGFVSQKKKREIAKNFIDNLSIKTPNDMQLIKNLSGGNQQKVLIARWLATNPQLIILDEPTRGIDVGAKLEIEKLIRSFATQGISVLFISSEIEELERNCDRIIVISDGRVVGELSGKEISKEMILAKIAGGDSGV